MFENKTKNNSFVLGCVKSEKTPKLEGLVANETSQGLKKESKRYDIVSCLI